MNRYSAPISAAEQQRIDQFDSHRDTALYCADFAGVTGIIAGVALILWMLAKCGPTLLPWLFQ